MQSSSPSTLSSIERDTTLRIFTRAIAEWEINSYYDYTISAPDSIDEKLFPTESIGYPRRPESGLPKLIINKGLVQDDESFPKFRIPSDDSYYRYYRSSTLSDEGGAIDFSASIEFDSTVQINKIVAGFETSYSSPVLVFFDVEIDDEWVYVGSDSPGENGIAAVYYSESWSNEELFSTETVSVSGVRIRIEETSEPLSAIDLIQISPRLSYDMSERIISSTVSKEREDSSLASPLGLSTSSTGSVSMSNHDRFFDPNNESSPVSSLLERNVLFKIYHTVFSGESFEDIPQITFFVESWSIDSDGIVSVEGRDRSKFLQEASIERSFYKDKSIVYIIKDIVERFGITKYEIRYTEEDENTLIPFMFFDNNKTVWEVLNSIAIAEQSIFYFDELDTFVWESRDYLWSKTSPDLVLRGKEDGEDLPNIISYSRSHEVSANHAKIGWKQSYYNACDDSSKNKILWEKSDDIILSSSPLITDILESSDHFYVDPVDYQFFPQEGIVNIDSEYIRYTKSSTIGRFDISERGLYGSIIKDHLVRPDSEEWSFYTLTRTERRDGNGPLGRRVVSNSKLLINTPLDNVYNVSHFTGGASDDTYSIYGCNLKFPLRVGIEETPVYDGDGLAGMFIHSDGDRGGYYIELITSLFSGKTGIKVPEVRVWKFDENNDINIIAGYIPDSITEIPEDELLAVSGSPFSVFPGTDYDINVYYTPPRTIVPEEGEEYEEDAEIRIFVNGQQILVVRDNEFTEGKWGLFSRGRTLVEFDYIFAVDRLGVDTDLTTSQKKIFDKIRGGFQSNLLSDLLDSYNLPRSEIFIEDFGPIAQEVIEIDVKYEVSPAIYSDLFISNENKVFLVYHDRDQFSSRFAVANKSRGFTVLSGSDIDTGTNMRLFIYGQPVVRLEENEYTVSNESSIVRNGKEEVQVSSEWIQTEDHAKRIGDWIITRWPRPTDFIELEVVSNPLIQIGDLVAIDMPEEGFTTETHRYHVVSSTMTAGLEDSMSLGLRRSYN